MGNGNDVEMVKLLSSIDKSQQNEGMKLIYDEYFEPFKLFFFKKNADQQTIEDIFQDSIISLYMNIRNSKFTLSSNLLTYLIAIGKNIWFKKLRKKRSTIDINGLSNVGSEDEYLDFWTKKEEIDMIKELMEQLGDSCKTVLTMFYVDRFRMKEIAIRLDYANDQVARNKKSKCLSKLIALHKKANG